MARVSVRGMTARERWRHEWRRVRMGRPALRDWHGAQVASARMPLRVRERYAATAADFRRALFIGALVRAHEHGNDAIAMAREGRTVARDLMVRCTRETLAHFREHRPDMARLP